MKLRSIRLAEFRRFVQPLELAGLEPGINLFVGPNEAGKSTVAAAIRAAFLERYKTSKVADFAPFGASGSRPTVELEFDCAGHRYTLRKSFLTRPRCELLVDGAGRLEGERAEEALAALLGFAYPAKGQSRPEHAGVPGLLWIQQGESGERGPLRHAHAHLREALQQVSGELAGGEGDRLLARIDAERGTLLDARGKPKGAYREAQEALELLEHELAQLRGARRALDEAIEQLAGLRLAHAEDARDPPWVGFERQAAEARERAQAAARQRAELDVLLRERRQFDEQIALLQEAAQREQQELVELEQLRRDLRRLESDSEAEEAGVAGAQAALAQAREAASLARTRHEAARRQAEWRDVLGMVERQRAETARLLRAVEEARRLEAELARLREAAHALALDEAELARLRELERELQTLGLRQQAAATRLRYRVDHPGVTLDGAVLQGEGEHWLTGAARIGLPGGGELEVEPGGEDLPRLVERQAVLAADRDELLRRMGVESLAQAERRWAALQANLTEARGRERELAIHAPQGVALLEQAGAEGEALLARLHARLALLDDVADAEPEDAGAAQARLELAEGAVEQAERRLQMRREQAQQARLRLEQARHQADGLSERLESDAARARQAQRALRLAELRALREQADRRIDEAKARLDGYDPGLNQQDIERFERSARIAREAFQGRHERMLLLQGRLDEAGAQGLGERLAEAEASAERWRRRLDAIVLRVRALTLLRDMLHERREAATARLQAPLAQRLARYLRLLFGEARVTLGENLMPAHMVRDERALDIALLSHGTQEQIGILARFAYADILREAGRPALIILDDALVHTDARRLAWMKRAVFDAATRHQILIFTCHEAAWRDLGVAPRALAAEGADADALPG